MKKKDNTIYSIQLSESKESIGVIKRLLDPLGSILSMIYYFTMHTKTLLRQFLFDIGFLGRVSIEALAMMPHRKANNDPVKTRTKEISHRRCSCEQGHSFFS